MFSFLRDAAYPFTDPAYRMSQYFMELGCRVANPTEREQTEFKMPNKAVAAQRRIAKLKLPLDFPKTRLPPRRR